MRKWLWLTVLAAAVAYGAGCAGITRTGDENVYTFRQSAELDVRGMADDWNMIWLADRQTRLSRWYTR